MELIHLLHGGLGTFVAFVKLVLESISVLCVSMGILTSLIMVGGIWRRSKSLLDHLPALRLQFGNWLAVALEFQLGADIVATTVNPSLQSLLELGMLALIRTFLNYFLQKELEAQSHLIKIVAEREPQA